MKYIKQFSVIVLVTCIGEILKYYIPLPIPASIYGLILMLVLLMTRIVKLDQVKNVADFLIEIMPVMFIPSTVALVTSWSQLRPILLPVLAVVVVSTVAVMIVTGKVSDALIGTSSENDRQVAEEEGRNDE